MPNIKFQMSSESRPSMMGVDECQITNVKFEDCFWVKK
ncbi:hypothetical protein ES703_72318 [subsurface metagenome]